MEGGPRGWGIDGARLQALRDAAPVTIYTPGSTSGVGLDVVGRMTRPAEGADAESVFDEASAFVSGVLALVGIDADPLASREHILLTNLVQAAWAAGQDLDLAGLVGQVQRAPLRRLGVFELDEFFPPTDRTALALRLNGLLASPAFAAWGQGVPLDIDALLRPGGRPACALVWIAHLAHDERQMVVTLVLSKLVTWMRGQPGTDQLPRPRLLRRGRRVRPARRRATGQGLDPHSRQAGPGLRRGGGARHPEPGRHGLQGAVQRRDVAHRLAPDRAGQGPPARRPVVGRRGADTAAVGATVAGLETRVFVLR